MESKEIKNITEIIKEESGVLSRLSNEMGESHCWAKNILSKDY